MSEKKGRIIFTDRRLYTLPEIYEPFSRTLERTIARSNLIGFYNIAGNRSLSVVQEGIVKSNQRLFHEFGHTVDHYAAQIFQLEEKEQSDTAQFKKIFGKEGKNLTEYGSTHPAEFFAEAFWLMHTTENRATVKERAPETYTFIKNILEIIT